MDKQAVISRPLPKKLIKKMFLKLLYEHRKGGRYANHGHDYKGILKHKLPEYYGIDLLSRDEFADGLQAVTELERDGFIRQDASQSDAVFKELTERGRELVKRSIEDMQIPSVEIDKLLTREDLLDKVREDFLVENYEDAIFKASKLLEEAARDKANLSEGEYGKTLMNKAFRPNGGILSHPESRTPAEKEGLHNLMVGAILWFKNPRSHRTVPDNNPESVAQALSFLNLLLDLVDQCKGLLKKLP